MGPVIALAAIALLVGFGWRSMRKEHRRVVNALKKAEASLDKRAPMTLERDPATGVYKPRKSGR